MSKDVSGIGRQRVTPDHERDDAGRALTQKAVRAGQDDSFSAGDEREADAAGSMGPQSRVVPALPGRFDRVRITWPRASECR